MTALLFRAASLTPTSFNRQTRTVEAVLSAGSPVNRAGFVEILDTAEGAWSAAGERVPLLDGHARNVAGVLGSVGTIRAAGGVITGTLTIADARALDLIEAVTSTVSASAIGCRAGATARIGAPAPRRAGKSTKFP